MTLLRRLRGMTSTALLWAAAWGLAGTAAYAVMGVRWTLDAGRPLSVGEIVPHALDGAVFLTIYGLLSGAAFAGVLMLAERGRMIPDLTIRRVATWGALGGIGILALNTVVYLLDDGGPMPGDMVPVLAIMSLLGAGCAAGSLVLARRATRLDNGEGISGGVLVGEQPLLDPHVHEVVHEAAAPARAPREKL